VRLTVIGPVRVTLPGNYLLKCVDPVQICRFKSFCNNVKSVIVVIFNKRICFCERYKRHLVLFTDGWKRDSEEVIGEVK
jgi:hypothetical protein